MEYFCLLSTEEIVCAAFGEACWQDISQCQQTLCAQMVHGLFQLFVNEVAEHIRRIELSEPVPFKVEEMNDIGKGKIRYIGGWAIRKVLETSRRYLKDNKFSTVASVRARLAVELRKMEMLENDVIVPYELLQNETEHWMLLSQDNTVAEDCSTLLIKPMRSFCCWNSKELIKSTITICSINKEKWWKLH